MSRWNAIGPSDNGECGLQMNQAKRLKELEKENERLRKAVSDLTREKLILREAASGNFIRHCA